MKGVFERVLRGKMNEKMSRETRALARVFFEKNCPKKQVSLAIKGLHPAGGVIGAGKAGFEMGNGGVSARKPPIFGAFRRRDLPSGSPSPPAGLT
jgi:hypothetical protein